MNNTNISPTSQMQGLAPLLQVFDMPLALKFYRDVLNFKIVHSSGEGDDVDWVLLKLNSIELILNTAYEKPNRPPQPDEERSLAHHPGIDGLYAYLINKGMHFKALQLPVLVGRLPICLILMGIYCVFNSQQKGEDTK